MAHVIKVERATKAARNGTHGKSDYRDPDRVERARTFDKKGDAEDFASTIETDIPRGDYVDPRAGKVPLNAWVPEMRAAGLTVKPKTKSGYEPSVVPVTTLYTWRYKGPRAEGQPHRQAPPLPGGRCNRMARNDGRSVKATATEEVSETPMLVRCEDFSAQVTSPWESSPSRTG